MTVVMAVVKMAVVMAVADGGEEWRAMAGKMAVGGGPDFGGGHAPFGGGSYDAAGDPISGPVAPGGPPAPGNPFGWADGYFGGGLFGDMFESERH